MALVDLFIFRIYNYLIFYGSIFSSHWSFILKRQNLLKNIFVFVRFVCIVMMLAGLAGIISAVAERSNSLSELTLLEERSSRANELERYLKKDENKYE